MNSKHISSPELYKHYYLNQAEQKGGGAYFAGKSFQRGYGQRGGGIGNFFGRLIRKALPYFTSASKNIGKLALKTGANVLADTASGQNFQDSLQHRMNESGKEIKRRVTNQVRDAMDSQTGGGKKRKGNQKATNTTKKQKANPIKGKKSAKAIRSSKATKPRTFQDIFGSEK